jgi:hypothetical protein
MTGKEQSHQTETGGGGQRDEGYPGQDSSRGNQVRDEPVPASRDDEQAQEAVVRNEEHAAGELDVRPSPRSGSGNSGG